MKPPVARLLVRTVAACCLILAAAGTALADRRAPAPMIRDSGDAPIRGAVASAAKAVVDTVLLMGPVGSGAVAVGSFENAAGQPDWNGWTHRDLTVNPAQTWHADTYNAVSGLYSAWCGDDFPSCGGTDPAGGYGNNYFAELEWRGQVDDPSLPCTVDVAAVANIDTETDYDYVHVVAITADDEFLLWSRTGAYVAETIGATHTWYPSDYLGEAGDEVVIRFRVVSDGFYSDEDCEWPTAGAIQLDDVVIASSNGEGAAHDFEDGTLGPFTVVTQVGVGDFAGLWTGLDDLDPCVSNGSTQVAFIDDGLVVPGTGGSVCMTWCYGPGGYVLNSTGGLVGEGGVLNNVVESPVIPWPDGVDGATLDFDVYAHELLANGSPGMFWFWEVRSASGADPQAIEDAIWYSDDMYYMGRPAYRRISREVSDLLVGTPDFVQVRLGVYHFGMLISGFTVGNDATPAPYFDNVRLRAYELQGPVMWANTFELAIDDFAAEAFYDPGSASARFDMAKSKADLDAPRVAGDSLVVTIAPARPDAEVVDARLHYRLRRNPEFDPWRTSGFADEGEVACSAVPNRTNLYSADLPDSGFLFPGDVIHYYFSGTDAAYGDYRTSLLPADTTGFADFDDLAAYDERFVMRALPSRTWSSCAPRLLWIEGSSAGAWDGWVEVLDALCAEPGVDFDVFYDRGPGFGLGAAAALGDLSAYNVIYYASGSSSAAIEDGDGLGTEDTAEAALLEAWFQLGSRSMFVCGDDAATSMAATPGTAALLSTRFGVASVADDIRPIIGMQTSPLVLAVPGVSFAVTGSWVADGGCPLYADIDAVNTTAGGVRAAEFADGDDLGGAYPYAALVVKYDAISGSVGWFMPYDLLRVAPAPGDGFGSTVGKQAALLQMLDRDLFDDCLQPVGLGCVMGVGDDGAVPAAERFGATASPNPFNPQVTIAYTVTRPGALSVKIFDLRGRLVRTVLDRRVAASGSVEWDGRDEAGGAAASGVYFYEVRMDNDVHVGKLALIR